METRASDRFNSLMNDDPAKLSLSNFLAGESNDPLQAPASFTNWMRVGAWAVQLYEPELLATADARTVINYGGKPRPVIKPIRCRHRFCQNRTGPHCTKILS